MLRASRLLRICRTKHLPKGPGASGSLVRGCCQSIIHLDENLGSAIGPPFSAACGPHGDRMRQVFQGARADRADNAQVQCRLCLCGKGVPAPCAEPEDIPRKKQIDDPASAVGSYAEPPCGTRNNSIPALDGVALLVDDLRGSSVSRRQRLGLDVDLSACGGGFVVALPASSQMQLGSGSLVAFPAI